MSEVLNRNRLYALLAAAESDLRQLIREHLVEESSVEAVLGPAYDKALDRMYADEQAASAGSDVIDYLDLGDEVSVLHRHSDRLPVEVREALASSAAKLESLVPIRNRVMHARPLLADDYDNAAMWLQGLDHGGFSGDELKSVLREMRNDPTWRPASSVSNVTLTGAVNNLPIPDFDETGLVGRRKQVGQLKRLLLQGKYPVVTLTGPGGVGKSALALQTLHDLVDDEESPFELIAWVSLKTEHLTAAGVQSIRDAVRSLDEALPSLAGPLDDSFAGGVDELASALEDIPAILAIDNLETVSGDEVVELVDALPAGVRCFFTSRVGLGQVDRRIQIEPLEVKYAVDLFRRLCRARGLGHFARLEDQQVEKILSLLGTSPLAIKWFTLALEAGQSPDTILQQRGDLVRFCVRNVFESLGKASKDLAAVLAHIQRPVTIQDLTLYVPQSSADALRSSVQDLLMRSLCTVSLVEGSLAEQFTATEPLVDYLRMVGGRDQALVDRLDQAEDEYRREEERLRLERGRTPLRVNVVSGEKEHRAAALRLREILRQSKRGDLQGALDAIDSLRRLEPEYWEIHRVEAFLLSMCGQIDRANSAYQHALKLAPSAEEKARVEFFYAGHLSRRVHDAEGALEHARAAHTALRRPETALELGKILTYLRDFPAALQLLEQARGTQDIRGRLIAGTQTIDTLRRRAEVEASERRQPLVALNTLLEALDLGRQLLADGLRDRRLEEQLYACVSEALRAARYCPEGPERDESLRGILSISNEVPSPRGTRTARYVATNADRLLVGREFPSDLKEKLSSLAMPVFAEEDPSAPSGLPIGTDLVGRLKAWLGEQSYGFITAIDGETDFFFHASDLEYPWQQLFLKPGCTVEFTVSEARGKPRATLVGLRDEQDWRELQGRELTVRHKRGAYLFATDEPSGVSVFVGRHAFADLRDWDAVSVGSRLNGNLEFPEDGRYAAERQTVRLA